MDKDIDIRTAIINQLFELNHGDPMVISALTRIESDFRTKTDQLGQWTAGAKLIQDLIPSPGHFFSISRQKPLSFDSIVAGQAPLETASEAMVLSDSDRNPGGDTPSICHNIDRIDESSQVEIGENTIGEKTEASFTIIGVSNHATVVVGGSRIESDDRVQTGMSVEGVDDSTVRLGGVESAEGSRGITVNTSVSNISRGSVITIGKTKVKVKGTK